MAKLSEMPLSRVAANKRSMNRKPRVRLQTIKVLKIGKQETFLSLIQAGETYDRAKARCRIADVTLYNWRRTPEFCQLEEEAKQFAIDAAEGRLQGLLPRAVSVAEETLGDEDQKLKWDAAHKVLRGRGLLREHNETNLLGEIILKVKYDDDSDQRADNPLAELPAPSTSGSVRK